MKNIAVVFGTRPEIIKLEPVIEELHTQQLPYLTICTGQHKDLMYQMEQTFNLAIDVKLELMKPRQELNYFLSESIKKLQRVLKQSDVGIVIVQGDTTTALAAALAAANLKIPVAHIEAGLRSNNLQSPFPEELNRKIIDSFATFLFAPTSVSADNLKKENVLGKVHITGNTIVDAYKKWSVVAKSSPIELPSERFILVTAHRRENFGEPLLNIKKALMQLSSQIKIVLPLHPNPEVQKVLGPLKNNPNIIIKESLNYPEFLYTASKAYLLLSDSGGVQEEAALVHKPILVMRDTTERPEVLTSSIGELVGTDCDVICSVATKILSNPGLYQTMCNAINPFGDGTASKQIVGHIKSFLESK